MPPALTRPAQLVSLYLQRKGHILIYGDTPSCAAPVSKLHPDEREILESSIDHPKAFGPAPGAKLSFHIRDACGPAS